MNRRASTAILVLFVALWGVGLPRFAHLMSAHVPAEGSTRASCASCCSHCALNRAASDDGDRADIGEKRDQGDEAQHCPVCEHLATLISIVPALSAASVAWQPLGESVVESPTQVALRFAFDPHAPRGPPVRA